jgi:hypothetical protein
MKRLSILTLCCVAILSSRSTAGAEPKQAAKAPPKPSPAATALLERGVREVVFAERNPCPDGHWYANFGYFFDDPHRSASAGGGRLLKLDVASGKVTVLLEDLKGSVRDPCVHYDARKILFSYRKGGTAQFHLYEIDADGKGLKQLTDGIYDDLEPTYLPDGGIALSSGRAKRWVNCWIVQVATLHRCDGDGKNMRPLSANIEVDNTPWVLPDGRILFTRWEYVDRSQVSFHHLWTCNPDGTGQAAFYGNMHPGGVFIDAKPVPGTDRVVFIHSPGHGAREHHGFVATVTGRHGPDERWAEKRPGNVTGRDPYAVTADCILFAGGNKILLVDGAGKVLDLYTGGRQVHEPRPLVKRPRERVIPPRTDSSKATGTLVLANAYVGRKMQGVRKGEIKKLLVLETLPKPLNYGYGLHDFWPISHGGTFTLARILGTAPVESDGSAHFEVPANRPLFLIALNEKNESVKRMHSFLSVMPGEVLGCVGCHEKRFRAPASALPRVAAAMKRKPSRLAPVPGVPFTIDFPTHIQPILDKRCVECHSPDKPDGKVMLNGDRGPMYSHSYFTLTGLGLVSDGRNRVGNTAPRSVGDSASPLMKLLDGSHYEAKLTKAEIEMIRNWIHIGAPYPGTYAALGTGMVRYNTLTKGYGEAHKKAMAAFDKRCARCHKGRMPHMQRYSRGGAKRTADYFWDAHLAFNLSRPEKSTLLMASLSKKAGGWGLCKERKKKEKPAAARPPPVSDGVFADRNDPDYKALLALVEQGKLCLEENKRWDMPGFKPHPFYVREMKRYGVLPETFDLDRDKIDVFETDRRYFESMWHHPDGDGPKLYPNETMKKLLLSPKPNVRWARDLKASR